MHRQMLEAGYIENNIEYWASASFWQRHFDTPEITAANLSELAYTANLEVIFIGNKNLRNGNFKKASAIFNDIVSAYPFHIIALYCMVECYEGLHDYEKASSTIKALLNLIKKDIRAADYVQQV